MSTHDFLAGALFIGDPHLSSRVPGFRKDDYPRAALNKLRWCLDLAAAERLLPVLLGDLFHWPRDNANWLITETIALLAGRGAIGIVGNHDTTEKTLQADDSLAIIQAAGVLRLIDESGPWSGLIAGQRVTIGGTTWSESIPKSVDRGDAALSIWLSHHNVGFADGEEGWLRPREIPGVDVLINGHIHTPKPDIVRGATTWMNPGNICRVQRADAVREARPAVLRLDPDVNGGWRFHRVAVPHESFDTVFHSLNADADAPADGSAFIRGLESLQALRTAGGAGLMQFIQSNLDNFAPEVSAEILSLAQEVCADEQP